MVSSLSHSIYGLDLSSIRWSKYHRDFVFGDFGDVLFLLLKYFQFSILHSHPFLPSLIHSIIHSSHPFSVVINENSYSTPNKELTNIIMIPNPCFICPICGYFRLTMPICYNRNFYQIYLPYKLHMTDSI
jgi:hypothetical protein